MVNKEFRQTDNILEPKSILSRSSRQRAGQQDWQFETNDAKREELLKKLEQNYFLKFTGAVVSSIAVFHNLSPIRHNPIVVLKNTVESSTERMVFLRLGFDITNMDEKDITKEQYDRAVKFLTEGVENTLLRLLYSKRPLNGQESLVIESFKSIRAPGESYYTAYGIGTLLKQHFSIINSDEEKYMRGVIYRKGDVKTKTYKKNGLHNSRKINLQNLEDALRLEKSKPNHSISSERLNAAIASVERWKGKFVRDK